MDRKTKKVLKQIAKRESIKQKALEKGWRSRFTLWLICWSDFSEGTHLEWLGFYDEAMKARAKYGYNVKEFAKLTGAILETGVTAVANSALHEGIYNSNNNTITYGHIDNTNNLGPIFRYISAAIHTCIEQLKILFGAYKEDAFGLPVCWFKPKNVEEIKKAALEREAAKQAAIPASAPAPELQQHGNMNKESY